MTVLFQVIAVTVALYNEADTVFPTRMDMDTFIDPEATTSADNPEAAKDPNIVRQATLNSRVMSINVYPPFVPPLEACIEITLEHTKSNKGKIRHILYHLMQYMLTGSYTTKYTAIGQRFDMSCGG